ncbi:MAG: leucine-rich repeat protein, partial [Bacilli bacterium]|nr:leucine-rich repeat protein [Bacilli bacterium]
MKIRKRILGIISLSVVAIFTIGYLGYILSDGNNPTKINPSEVEIDDDYDRAFEGRIVSKENEYAGETYTSNLGYRVNDDDLTACVNMGDNDPKVLTTLVIPSFYTEGENVYTVTAVDYSGFVNMTALTSVTFNSPSNITLIDTQAFANDINLITFNASVSGTCTIPENLIEIYSSTFLNCSSFTELTFNGDGVTKIGDNAFNGCLGLKEALLFKYNLVTIGRSSFANCINIPSIMLPGGVNTIGDYAFYADKNVLLFAIPDSVNSIGVNAFRLCSKATAYIGASEKYPQGWPTDNNDSVSSDGDWNYATSNYEIEVITNTNNIMATDDFYYTSTWDSTYSIYRITIFKFINTNISELVIPATLPVLGNENNNNLLVSSSGTEYGVVTNVYGGTYDGNNMSLYGAFGDDGTCNNLTDITLPNTLENIEQYAFVGCTNLSSLTFVDAGEYSTFSLGSDPTIYNMGDFGLTGLTTIDDYAFCIDYVDMYKDDHTSDNETNPPITSLVLPTTIKSIGHAAFAQWSRIQSLVFAGAEDGTSNLQTIDDYAFCNLGHNSSS